VRVALVGRYPAPGRATGGVESSFVNLVAGLASLGNLELDVLTFAPDGASALHTKGIRVHRLEARQRFNNLTFYSASRHALGPTLERLRPDVVHAQNAVGYGYVCLKAARHVPVVVSVHGIVRETRKHLTSWRERLEVSLAGAALERYCIRRAPYLLQPTTYPEEYFGREIGGRVVEVGNAVGDEFFALEPEPKPGRVLYAGAIVPAKRVHDLVAAVARLPDASLRIAGESTDPRYAAKLTDSVLSLGLEERVKLLGALSRQRLLEEYRRASVLVLPSAQETSPMAIAEAMAAGIPVVATRVGGVPHLVEEGHTGFLVDVGDTRLLAQRVAQLLGDAQLHDSFASAARSRAERFRAAAVAARVRAVYEEAVR
jgi:glycosyltransferase involved in cell wall biosynthesis